MRSSGESQEKASEEAGRFIVLITKPTRRVHFAEKYQNYDIAIDVRTFVCLIYIRPWKSFQTIVSSLRDQTEMEKLVRKIPQEHPSYNRALYFYHVKLVYKNENWIWLWRFSFLSFRIQIGEFRVKIVYGIVEWIINLSEILGAVGSRVSIRCRSSSVSNDWVLFDVLLTIMNIM